MGFATSWVMFKVWDLENTQEFDGDMV